MNLQQVLDDAVQKGTFSLDAIEAIKKMKEENEALKRKANTDKQTIQDLRERAENCSEINGGLTKTVTEYKDRLKSIEDREKKMTLLECQADKHMAVAHAIDQCFHRVFKNPVFQSDVFKNTISTGYYDDKGAPIEKETGHSESRSVQE